MSRYKLGQIHKVVQVTNLESGHLSSGGNEKLPRSQKVVQVLYLNIVQMRVSGFMSITDLLRCRSYCKNRDELITPTVRVIGRIILRIYL